MRVRVSFGSAIGLGLLNKKTDKVPETVYIMLKGDCTGGCLFCAQSHGESDRLSRVVWPEFELDDVVNGIKNQRRVCIQCPNYGGMFGDLVSVIGTLPEIPVSVSIPPLFREELELLKGRVDRVGISLDAATEEIFQRVKPSYSWREVWEALEAAVEVFGRKGVSTHLIAGLGETEEEMARTIARVVSMGITPSLFAFTPLKGTALSGAEGPPLDSYRRLQVARGVLVRGGRLSDMKFEKGKLIDFGVDASEIINNPSTYIVQGCPDCDRPYYNEGPAGPFYNYPRKPDKGEMIRIIEELRCAK